MWSFSVLVDVYNSFRDKSHQRFSLQHNISYLIVVNLSLNLFISSCTFNRMEANVVYFYITLMKLTVLYYNQL